MGSSGRPPRAAHGPGGDEQTERGNFTPPGPGAPAPERADAAASATGSRFAPRNWRVATRLNAILLLPVIVALGLAGLRVQTHYDTWQEAERAQAVAELVGTSTAYAHALIEERDVTAAPLIAGDTDAPAVNSAREATDEARAAFEAQVAGTAIDDRLQRRLDSVEEVAPRLESVRQVAYTDTLGGAATQMAYVEIQHPVMAFTNELGLGTEDLASYGRSVYAVSLAKAALSLQRSLGTHMILAEDASAEDTEERSVTFASYVHLEGIARNEYLSAAGPDELDLLDDTLARTTGVGPGEESPTAELVPPLSAADFGAEELAAAGVEADAWFDAATDRFDGYRAVEEELVDSAVAQAQSVSSEARTQMITHSLLVVVLLLAAFVLAGLMARSMSKSMSRLRDAALGVAEERLPALVGELSKAHPGRVDTEVRPIRISSRDEIGEVSRAFDRVHGEAVRLATEQALLRGNVNAIFTNLSSRNQGLIERQLELITELENNAADPEQLENLFRLDHLATRMRRNGENLLVLAGEEPTGRSNEPVPLVDVVRAAASEVETYERVRISGIPESDIHGAVVNDLAHLLAELLENAASFSSPHTAVHVAATRLPDGRVMIEIHDQGVGLDMGDFADINHRLASPPAVDAEISRRMGLYVVGRLSQRHGIRVQLRPSAEQGGTTSLVMLPEHLTQGGGHAPQGPQEFTLSRFAAEQQPNAATAHPTLDPVRRSLRRGERQAELSAADRVERELGQVAASGGPPPGQPADPGGAVPDLPPRAGYAPPHTGGTGPHPAGPADAPTGQRDTPEFPPGWPYPHPGGAAAPQEYQEPLTGHDAFGHTWHDDARGAPDAGPDGGWGEHAAYAPPAHRHGAPGGPEHPAQQGESSRYAGEASDWTAFPEQTAGAEGHPTAPPDAVQRVGFDGAGPPRRTGHHSTTSAGLPLRTPQNRPDDAAATRSGEEPPAPEATSDQWGRGPRRDAVRSDGTTTSGLPKRLPQAHLTEHPSAEPAAGGPQISRAPEDVRGRLANLLGGVRRGRGASTGRDENDQEGFGPGSDQER